MDAALAAGKLLYITSAWGDLTIGQRIRSSTDLPLCEPFSLRLVSLPNPAGSDEAGAMESDHGGSLVPVESIQDAEVLPPVSSFSPERNVVTACA